MLLAHRTLEFDSIFACNDLLAVGALKYAKARGIRIPEEIERDGVYNNSADGYSTVNRDMTSVDDGVRQLWGNAVENLVKILQGQQGIGQG